MQVRRAASIDKKTGEIAGKEDGCVDQDECNRARHHARRPAGAAAAFDKTSGQGSVTAGNSSQLSDGASATLLMSAERAKALGIKPKLIFRGLRGRGLRARRDGHRPGLRGAEAAQA